jgi:gliding motility-associated-like protein
MTSYNTRRLLGAALTALTTGLYAQSYDLRLSLNNVDCKSAQLSVKVEVKANTPATAFQMGDANYRFEYPNDIIASPKILSEDNFSSQGTNADRNYGAQNLQGSRVQGQNGIISLNTFYTASNSGAKKVGTEWMPVATLGFDIKDFRRPMELKWHTDKMFPVTGMNQVSINSQDPTSFEYDLRDVRSSGTYANLAINPAALCPSKSPIVSATPLKTKMNKAIEAQFPIYDLDENDVHTVQLVSVGKGQATPSVYGKFLHLTYAPTTDFVGKDEVLMDITDRFGNTERVAVSISVTSDALVFNNGMSPNDDGKNDVFVIDGLEKYTETQLSVFDQWGREVYTAKNYKNDWNGRSNGMVVPNGTYYYVLEANKEETYTGYLQVAR